MTANQNRKKSSGTKVRDNRQKTPGPAGGVKSSGPTRSQAESPPKPKPVNFKSRKAQLRQLLKRFGNRSLAILLWPFRFFHKLFFITGILTWLLIVLLLAFTIGFFQAIPDFSVLTFDDLIIAGKDYVQRQLESEDAVYRWVPLRDVHRELLYTLVMAEDGKFFEHGGVNYDALFNALGENIKRRKFVFGASTISQQVVKNLYLGDAKTLWRKLREIVATRRMERYFTKNQILEIYVNTAEFGPEIFGVDRAAAYYFEKSPSEVNAAEGAFLALMLPSPRRYHFMIFQNRYISPQHERKRRRILRDMAYKEYISPSQYNEYLRYRYFDQ